MTQQIDSTPNFFLPFNFKQYHNKKIDISSNISWLLNMKLVQNIKQATFLSNVSMEYLTCCYPDIKNQLLYDMINFASWHCLLDDLMEENALFTKIEEKISFLSTIKFICEQNTNNQIYNYKLYENQPLIIAFIDLKCRISQLLSTQNYNYLMYSISHFMSGIIWELSAQSFHKNITINNYCAIKTSNVGVLMAYALSLAINNITIDENITTKPNFTIMKNCILFVMAIDNDLYSFNKEKVNNNKIFNIIDIIQHELDINLYEAISKSIILRNKLLKQYLILKDNISINLNINCYSKCFEDLISGNIYFGNTCERYTTNKDKNIKCFYSGPYNFDITKYSEQKEIEDIVSSIPSISWWI